MSNTRFLHVANGTATTALIEKAGLPGRRSIWADPLYEGPVPGGLSDAELLRVRARFLSGDGHDGDVDPVNDLRRWREAIDAGDQYDELVLWFEHDLFDQLNLVQLLSFVPASSSRRATALVSPGSFAGRPHFKGLGELTPAEIATLFEAREPVTPAQRTLAAAAWDAFRAPSPLALDRFRRTDLSALPYLSRALRRFLQEYPWTVDGLSRSERRLLQLATEDAPTLRTVFPRMHDDEDAYYITDLSLQQMALALSRMSPPLLELDTSTGTAPLSARARTTADGRHVLDGHSDRVAMAGIDRWLGGVHLHAGDTRWRWSEDEDRIVQG